MPKLWFPTFCRWCKYLWHPFTLCRQFQIKIEPDKTYPRLCHLFCPRDLVGTVQISLTCFLFVRLSHALTEYLVCLCKFRWMILLEFPFFARSWLQGVWGFSEDFVMYNFDLCRFMQQGTGTFCSCSRSGALASYISADLNSSVSVEKSTCPPIFQLTPGK